MPRRLPPLLHPSKALRFALLILALPCVYFGGASAAFFYRQHAANESRTLFRLSAMPAPARTTRLMVFAPHCDDETLGCAGLIQQTLAAGGAARAAILTNGDGYPTAVQRQMRELRVGPNDYIQFAALRQEESVHALTLLGLKRDNVLFFGYPDRGLMPLWNNFWTPDRPYTSLYTRCSRSPYALTFDRNAPYCGQSVVEDIKTALRDFRPTLVTVTHPAEDHPDHAAAAAFVERALQELQNDPKEASWAKSVQLRHYLIHRGDWPLPQGKHPTDSLLPPTEFAHLDTHWTTLALTPEQTERKAHSIASYPTQTALMNRFLVSFARRTELFGDLPPATLETVPDQKMRVDADPKDWESLPPVLLSPVRDNVLRDLQGGGDIRALYACRDRETLYLRLDTRQPVSRRMTFTLRLRAFGPQGETAPAAYTLRFRPTDTRALASKGVRLAIQGRILEAAIPWNDMTREAGGPSAPTLAVSADTNLAGVEVDQTGIRFLNLR